VCSSWVGGSVAFGDNVVVTVVVGFAAIMLKLVVFYKTRLAIWFADSQFSCSDSLLCSLLPNSFPFAPRTIQHSLPDV